MNLYKNKNYLFRFISINLIFLIILQISFSLDQKIKLLIFIYATLLLFINSIILLISKSRFFLQKIEETLKDFSFYIFLIDLILLAAIIKIRFIDKINNAGNFNIELLISLLFFSWLYGGIVYHHFNSKIDSNYWVYIWKYIKNYIFFILISIFILLYLFENVPGKFKLLEAIFLYSFSSWLFFTINFFRKIPPKEDIERIKFLRVNDFTDKINLDNLLFNGITYSLNGKEIDDNFPSIENKLKEVYLRNEKGLFEKLSSRVDFKTINIYNSVVLKSRDLYNIETLPDNKMELIINLHRLNDIRRINQYLIEVNKKLVKGGVFVCCFQSNDLRFEYFIKNYPYFLALSLYFLDFIIHRVLPKLPIVQKIYFTITKGNNRAIALSEGLGRLSFTGFNFVDVFKHNFLMYCIVYKVREPSTDPNPSYGLFFKMRRIGKDGKEFYVYKFRTMHPYSEYIQGLLYDLFKLEKGGKIRNDFRITTWGKILRKLWIDELPMLLNFIKGELKLVGVRPLSKHYYSLYPEDLKQLRIKTKPGLVPPFYYDLPKTLDEIFDSERKYLESYFKEPLLTDIKYFSKAFYNIVFKNARSG